MESNGEVIELNSNVPSLQVYQDIYNSITNKTESLRCIKHDPHVVRFEDIKNLHYSIEQVIEQYDCRNSSLSVTVSFIANKSESFSSFEKFELFALNRADCVDEVDFEYNFFIILPKTKEPKAYNLKIGIRSTLAVVEGFRVNKASEAEKNLFHMYTQGTMRLAISYVDIAVARSLESCVLEWYRALEKSKSFSFGSYRALTASVIGLTVRSLPVIAAAFLLFFYARGNVQSNDQLFAFGLISFVVLIISGLLANRVASRIEKEVTRIAPLSVVILSKADQSLQSKNAKSFWISILSWVFGVVFSIAVGLLVSFLGSKLGV
jgi:hypothetical protein